MLVHNKQFSFYVFYNTLLPCSPAYYDCKTKNKCFSKTTILRDCSNAVEDYETIEYKMGME